MASPAALSELFPGPGEWTEEDYFPLSDRGKLVELSDGDLEVLPVPTDYHQLLLMRLALAIQGYVSAHRLGRVRFAPLPVRLWPGKIREPDLMYMSAAHVERIGKYWGVPDLAVEIVSEGGEVKDRQIKRAEYAQAGIAEYWIVDPEARTVELLRLRGNEGVFDTVALLTAEETLASPAFPGFSLSLAEFFTPET